MASTDNKNPPVKQATAGADDYSIYFLNNIVLNRSDYSIHARKVWDDMQKDDGLSAGNAIENYLKKYNEIYEAAHKGKSLPDSEIATIRGELIPQISRLQKIELSIKGLEPTPEQIADNYIETRVQSVEGVSKEDIASARQAIIDYETLEVTPEATINAMRNSWTESKMLPDRIDYYTTMLEQKIEHYQSGKGGGLDNATASARAAVDIRAQVDTNNGVNPSAVVDENHTYYQSDILQMGNWVHNKVYEQNSGDMESLNKVGYGTHRRYNIEQAMGKAYDKAHPEPEKKPEPETISPEKQQELKTLIEEKETAQNNVTTDLLKNHRKEVAPFARQLTKMGVDLSSGEAIATSLRNPQVLASVNGAIKQYGAMIPNAIKNTIADFNTIEIERRQLQEQITTASQQSKATDGQGIKSDIPTSKEFNGKAGETKHAPTPETYDDVPVIPEDEPQTTAEARTFNSNFNAI